MFICCLLPADQAISLASRAAGIGLRLCFFRKKEFLKKIAREIDDSQRDEYNENMRYAYHIAIERKYKMNEKITASRREETGADRRGVT